MAPVARGLAHTHERLVENILTLVQTIPQQARRQAVPSRHLARHQHAYAAA